MTTMSRIVTGTSNGGIHNKDFLFCPNLPLHKLPEMQNLSASGGIEQQMLEILLFLRQIGIIQLSHQRFSEVCCILNAISFL